MAKSRPPYPAAFRQQMVDLAKAGRKPAELSKEFGCSIQTILNWIALDASGGAAPKSGNGLSASERDELIRLRREVKQLRQERDILGKATAWFAMRGEKIFTPSSDS